MADKVLVTGAAGFIGSNLAEALCKKGYHVRGIDCFTDYYPRQAKEKNLSSLKNQKNFEFIEENLCTYDISKLLEGVSTIYHEAAQAGVRYSWGHFQNYIDNNIIATQRILEACRKGKQRVVFASSSSVYGNAKDLPVKETTELNPISPYGVTKVACEKLFQIYNEAHGIPANILRYFTVYGPKQRPDMAINIFTHKIMNGEKFEIFGDGSQARDFTYVDDIVAGTIAAGESSREFDTYNIGGGSTITVKGLVDKLGELIGKEPNYTCTEEQKGDVKSTHADISKAASNLGYTPRTKIIDGLKNYVDFVKS
ncbi:MAG: GDP-mannose 4,6-dehydratase [archaeon]